MPRRVYRYVRENGKIETSSYQPKEGGNLEKKAEALRVIRNIQPLFEGVDTCTAKYRIYKDHAVHPVSFTTFWNYLREV
jgi:hypothetical protein